MQLPVPAPGLVEALRNRAAVAIVGSGMSLPAGGPTWDELLYGLAAQAYETQPQELPRIAAALTSIESGGALDGAAILKDVLGPQFFDAVVDQLKYARDIDIDKNALAREED